MNNYAIIENDQIVNVIVAESQETAAAVTGCLVMETNGEPWIGWTLSGDAWIPPMPEEPLEETMIVTPEQEAALIDAGWIPPINQSETPAEQQDN